LKKGGCLSNTLLISGPKKATRGEIEIEEISPKKKKSNQQQGRGLPEVQWWKKKRGSRKGGEA